MVTNATGVNLGNAYGKVTITTNAADAMAQAKRDIDNGRVSIGQSLQQIGGSLQGLGGSLTTLTAPLAIFGATGLKAASDFDSAMTQISARTGLTGDALEKVRQQALQLGADTVFSSQQAADAYLQLLTAGLTTAQATATLPNVLTAAAASGEDLGLAADLMTNVMSSFNLEADESVRIVEAMSRAAASSPASMAEIGFALQDAGGIAKSFGLELEDTAGLFSIFAKNGIRGSEAATQLRSMLLNMTKDTEGTNQAWSDLGTSMFDNEGQMRDLDTVLKEISVSLEGMSDEDRNRIMKELGGAYGLVGLNALLASDGIDAMKETMDGQASASDVAEQRMNTFEGAVNSLMGSIQTLQIEALTPFMDQTLKPLVQDLIGVVNGITAWVVANPELAQTFVKLGAIAVIAGPALVILGTVISAIGTVVGALGTALSLLFSPLVLVAVAIAAIIAAAEFGYEGGIVGLFTDATLAAQQLAFLGLYFLNLAAQNAKLTIDGFILTVTAVKDAIVDWTINNGGLLLGLSSLIIILKTTGLGAMFFNGIMAAGQVIYASVTTWLGLASGATAGLAASMLAAVGPIVAIGLAIAGVIYQMGVFANTVNNAQRSTQSALADEYASGAVTIQDVQKAAFDATSKQFGGGILGDLAARLTYSNTANAAVGDQSIQGRDSGGPGLGGVPYAIGKGAQPEVFVPETSGQFIPNFDKLLEGAGGTTIGDINVYGATNYQQGLEAGRGAGDGVLERLKSRGLK